MNTNNKINECINQFEMSQSEHELRMLEIDREHELMMLELDRQHELIMREKEMGWLGRFFEKIFGR